MTREKDSAVARHGSPFVSVDVERTVHLRPEGLKDVEMAVRQQLNGILLQRDSSLGAVVIGYTGLRALSQSADLYDDQVFVNVRVALTYIVFTPCLGQLLVGRVTKVGLDHIGLLVYGTFNATLPNPANSNSGFTYDAATEAWTNGKDWISVGNYVKFRLTDIEESSDVLSMIGTLLGLDRGTNGKQKRKSAKPIKKKKKVVTGREKKKTPS